MDERVQPALLPVSGTVPHWISGALYRIGPGKFSVPLDRPAKDGSSTFEVEHWFDGLAQVHKYTISSGQVIHRSKDTATDLEEHIRKHGHMRRANNFGQSDPCKTIFGRFMNFFQPAFELSSPTRQNVQVTVSTKFPLATDGGTRKLVAKTDSVLLQVLDPDTLEPLELFDYSHLDSRLTGQMAASHACFFDGAMYNYNLDLKRRVPQYHVFEVRETGTRILATFDDCPAAYMHSLQVTERFVILTLWDADVWGPAMAWHGAFYKCLQPPTGRPTLFCVIDRVNGGFVAKYEAPNFFCFHTINSYDDPADGSIVVDLAIVDSWKIMDSMFLAEMRKGKFVGSRPARYRLPCPQLPAGGGIAKGDATVEYVRELDANIELMSVRPECYHRPYRYTYGCHHRDSVDSIFSAIIKLDMSDPSSAPAFWIPPKRSSVGEPIFVARPEGTEEDDGVLMTVVLSEGDVGSYLVFLDARSMTEIGRAEAGRVLPPGFHGSFDAKL